MPIRALAEAVQAVVATADRADVAASKALRAKMLTAFTRATQYEWLFWDSAYTAAPDRPPADAGPRPVHSGDRLPTTRAALACADGVYRRDASPERALQHRGQGQALSGSWRKPSPQRLTWPTEGDGKCIVQHNVLVSQ
jgi:hypothetical protein